ncbi:GNAT family N-acetyltransferase [Chachezhania antarctica]|uniref:GNAT family N-acetyltransferase n=1 Tax=Chachezhania antarctica TaxID=2340860 RepID=UPI000EB32CB6|nr:GNAT family N-acetyltransferase [Chachezhania antarctica]|tara:strand:+ start:7378 stop:7920 length:543 start_codon:yes stop_codon:yes gene_type:complete
MTIKLANTPLIETERLNLRAPHAGDVDAALDFLVSDRARFIGGPYTRDGAWRNMGNLIGHWVMRGYGLFVVTEKGSDHPLGGIGPWYPESWTDREIGWSMWSPEAEGKGYAFEAAQAARAYAYDNLGWTTAISYIDPENERSIALAMRMGCTLDEGFPYPDLDGWEGTLVFRHPSAGVPA